MSFASYDGRPLWYSERGSGPPVLFIHGGGSDGKMWAQDLESLTTERRVITYSRRGYPGSGPPAAEWTVHTDDAAAIIEALAEGPIAVVGYSIGSVAAVDLAIRRPELVSRLVLLDPAFRARTHMTPGMLRAFATAQILRRLGRPHQGIAVWHRYVMAHRGCDHSVYDQLPADRRARLQDNAEAVFADFAAGDGSHVPTAAIEAIAAPTTVITAELSPPFLRSAGRWLGARIPSARLVVLDGSGHAVSADQPDRLRMALLDATSP